MDIHGSALVTGASRGIGRAVALELAHRGFDTVATMRDPAVGADMAEKADGRLEVRRLDVTDPMTFDLPGDLRVLVNNAGVDTDYLPVEHANIDDWRRMFETNVFGTVALTSAAIATLRQNRPSVICTITSSSIIAAVPFFAAYRASKAAASAFGDSLRVEVAPFGIRVVEILPGPVDTDMFRLSTGEQVAAQFPEYRAPGRCRRRAAARARRPARGGTGRRSLGDRRRDRRLLGTDALRLRPGFARADGPVAPERRRDRLRRHRPGDLGPGRPHGRRGWPRLTARRDEGRRRARRNIQPRWRFGRVRRATFGGDRKVLVQLDVVLAVFPIIFLGELPDKTMFASLVLSTRGRPATVWLGAAAAFAVHVVIAVTIGVALFHLLPHRALEAIVAAMFFVGGVLALREARKAAE